MNDERDEPAQPGITITAGPLSATIRVGGPLLDAVCALVVEATGYLVDLREEAEHRRRMRPRDGMPYDSDMYDFDGPGDSGR